MWTFFLQQLSWFVRLPLLRSRVRDVRSVPSCEKIRQRDANHAPDARSFLPVVRFPPSGRAATTSPRPSTAIADPSHSMLRATHHRCCQHHPRPRASRGLDHRPCPHPRPSASLDIAFVSSPSSHNHPRLLHVLYDLGESCGARGPATARAWG